MTGQSLSITGESTIVDLITYWPKINKEIMWCPVGRCLQHVLCEWFGVSYRACAQRESSCENTANIGLWVETFRPVMSQINHPTQSAGRGSAEISQAEKAQKEKGEFSHSPRKRQELTHQPLHGQQRYRRLARMRAWHYVGSSEHSSHCSFSSSPFFSPSHSLSVFLYLAVPTAASDKTNKSFTYISRPHTYCLFSTFSFFFSPSISFPMRFFMLYFSPLAELCLHALWPFVFFSRTLQQ